MPIPVSATNATRSAVAPRSGRTAAARTAITLSSDTRIVRGALRCEVRRGCWNVRDIGTSEKRPRKKFHASRNKSIRLLTRNAPQEDAHGDLSRRNTVGMDVDVATFEARAEEAERRIAALELKISEGATVPAAPAGDAAAGDEFKKKFYDQLVALRVELGKSRVERAAMIRQAEEDKAKIEMLEEENTKMSYRIKHLVRAVREEMAKKYPEAKNVDR